MMKLFKEGDGLKNCNAFWDMSGIIPTPKEELTCTCGEKQLSCKHVRWISKSESKSKYRCDITFKCYFCSKKHSYGVVVDEKTFERGLEFAEKYGANYRTYKQYL